MAKRGMKVKEGEELANFPEEKPTVLLSPRYLAIAASLILVFSAFASLLVDEDVTGQVTSAKMTEWDKKGLKDTWRRYDTDPDVNNVDEDGLQIPSDLWNCPFSPEKRRLPPKDIPINKNGCFNVEMNSEAPYSPPSTSRSRKFACRGIEESGGREIESLKPCTRM